MSLSLCIINSHAKNSPIFSLQIPDINKNSSFSKRYLSNQFGCNGENIRPLLKWENAPSTTKSFAITLYDKDAPTGSGFWQWVVIDIPASTSSINSYSLPYPAKQQKNDAGSLNWLGPCPPIGSIHHYKVQIYALDISVLPVKNEFSAALIGYFIHMHTIASASQVFTVSR